MAFQSLIGKLAPPISLPNYTGETYKFIPGEKGTPAAIFFYPAAGLSKVCTDVILFLASLYRFLRMYPTSLSNAKCYRR